jgi:hypothetical protein
LLFLDYLKQFKEAHMYKLNLDDAVNIPTLIQVNDKWINWRAGLLDANGKFPKYPICPFSGYKIDAHNKANQISFEKALLNTSQPHISGIGFVLDGRPILTRGDGVPLYLAGVDIDFKANLSPADVDVIWLSMGCPYIETSPSGRGVRIFCLTKQPIPNRNQNGYEVYSSKRFLTVTGWNAKGNLIDCTESLEHLIQSWFPVKQLSRIGKAKSKSFNTYPPEETPRNKAWVMELLSFIDPDCSYDDYRNVIWALEATDWSCIDDIQRSWSLGASHRFSEDGLTVIKASFDGRAGGITFGTLVHYARLGGYQKHSVLARIVGEVVV